MNFVIREMQPEPEDFAAVVGIDNAVDPEHRYTAEQFRYDYENFDTRKYIMRYYLAEANIVPHLVCKGNMVVPYLDFRKFPQPARSLYLIQLTQNQV
jgi:hypothetical protein